MNKRETSREELLEITLAYVEGRENGTGPTLEELVERYPHYAEELIDFAMYYQFSEEMVTPSLGATSGEELDLTLERQTLDRMFPPPGYTPALTSLIACADQQGMDVYDLASELDLGVDVLIKLEHRLIYAESLPLKLFEELERLLRVTRQQLQQFFAEPPREASAESVSFYGWQQSTLGPPQDFPEAIRSSRFQSQNEESKWLLV